MSQYPTNRQHGHPNDRSRRYVKTQPRAAQQAAAKRPAVSFIYDFFISYSFTDRQSAELLCEHLERRGYKCFVAHRDIPKGAAFAQMIPWAVEKSRVMVTLLTKHFDASVHTSREVSLATEGGMPIMTVRMEDCELTGMKKYYLREINWIDASEGIEKSCDEIEATFKRLAESNPTRIPTSAPRKTAKIYKKRILPMAVNVAVFVVMAILIVILFRKNSINEQIAMASFEKADSAQNAVNDLQFKVAESAQTTVAEVDTVKVDEIQSIVPDAKKLEAEKFNKLLGEFKNVDFRSPEQAKAGIEKLEGIVSMIERNPALIEPQDGRELREKTEGGVKVSKNDMQKAQLQFALGKLYYYRVGYDSQADNSKGFRDKAESNFKKAGKIIQEAKLYEVLSRYLAQYTRIQTSQVEEYSKRIAKLYEETDSVGNEVEYYYKRSAALLARMGKSAGRDSVAFNKAIERKYVTHTDTIDIVKKIL